MQDGFKPRLAYSIQKTGRSVRNNPFFGTPEGTRTPDLLIRSQSLYPTELLAHKHSLLNAGVL